MRIVGLSVYSQPSESMAPTIPKGDYFFASAWPYADHDPKRGDIIVFQYPANPSVLYAKRVIALGGEVLEIRHCVALINGQQLNESYVDRSRATKSCS
jgi:signal peptidase I